MPGGEQENQVEVVDKGTMLEWFEEIHKERNSLESAKQPLIQMTGEFYHTNGLDFDPAMLEFLQEDYSDASNGSESEILYHYNMTKDSNFGADNGIPKDLLPVRENYLTVDKPVHLNL